MGGKAPFAVRGREGRSANDVSGIHAEAEDSSFGKTENCTMKRCIALLALVCSILLPVMSLAQERPTGDEIKILPVHNNVYMLASSAGNTTVQVGEDGIVIVDTLTTPLAERKSTRLNSSHIPLSRMPSS